MKINKLVLKNFRSYEEETTFNLNTTSDKNIILIGGKNGAGKSTIFEAIKLCIYGPMAYKYQGFNASYISQVKSNINNNSLINSKIDTLVSVDIEISEGTEENIYTLIRQWTFKDEKLNETFLVYKNFSTTPLNADELNYFENYITSIISPKIFDFFFFDGEHLYDFFVGKNSNIHLKESLLSLCNFDTFDILKKVLISTNRSNKNVSDEINIVKDSYLNLEMEINTLNSQEEIFSYELQKISNEIEKLQQEQLEVKKEFRKKGGILAEERETLNSRIAELEGKRFIINQNIKEFCNDILPFLIVKKQISNLEKQLKTENDILLYSRLKDKLNIEYIKNLLSDKIMPSALDEIALTVSEALTEDIKPDSYEENFKSIHNLSDDESRKLLSLINTILNFDNNSIINSFEEHRSISNELADIRHKLNTSLKDESLNTYINDMSNLSSKIDSLLGSKNLLVTSLDKLKLEIAETKSRRDKSKAKYIYLLQHNNIVDISTNLILMLDEIVTTLTETKIKLIQDNFMYIFKKIIQKDNFISHIDINVNFDISLYINKIYNSLELENLAKNIGIEGMEKKLGKLFFDDLFNLYSVEDKYELFNVIRNNTQSTFLNLRTKVDIDEFSSGEKQIYVLCLYWALLKSSGIEIPFIIDTPYARIDDTHRNSITSEYFSTISHQIIILSTNTEIDEKLYKIIKPKLSREYLLEYDSKNKKTIQNKGYFFEV
ncbi:TPA: AAA family ATPase [Clostridioides difficile]|uniref:DNA sulfur modification protein DndD n=3 Tax=Clostridioides difficile TaxID=1496 RepID=A0AC59G319_CLODI|nr:AAA family ATPase [Clostridioides difficile]OFU33932.1 DNA sulfur modification protein DndD [Clostridium sp. HMSC19B12]AKP44068.1 DNA sulfur modification protein DndD [Clostridioides difficile ATCC 9689 = DSM 1296]ARC15781.1 DNA sulfur modification protein DndD [Clostridioides difficile]AVI13599.1 DNA sulfur modification protein DndD [Clostridioides difficile]AXU88099.1 DNA sulfur modification protein DndD [Clostridioides difficile]